MYLTKYIIRCYGVTFQTNVCIKVLKFEDLSDDENNVFV